MFIDRIKIIVKAGDGGNGCASFFPRIYGGGPNGGDGGWGGDIFFQGDCNLKSLDKLQLKRIWRAENGKSGSSNQKNGHKGKSVTIKVPLGCEINYDTKIFNIDTEEKFLFQKGGKGGLGNSHFVSSINQSPSTITEGEKKLAMELKILLKLKADVGIVGLPNSGKSSFLNRVSNAKSRVAEYAFSTLYPCLGANNGLLFVDVPGLIEGASQNRGLGHRFLSHVEKCKVLLLLVDISNNPLESLQTLQNELIIYGLCKPKVVCFNKCEKLTRKKQLHIRSQYPEAFFISVHKSSITKLFTKLLEICKKD